MSDEQPPRGRLARLFDAADRRHVPLRTILVTAGVVIATYLTGKLMYLLRDVVLLMLVAGFVAMLLNPVVARVQQRIPRRGPAVMVVTLWAVLIFIGLAAAFGVPLVSGVTHLADRLPGYVASAQHGTGWIGHLVVKYHVQSWVQRNTPRLVGYAQSLGKPALAVGKGAVSVVVELLTIFVLVLLLLLEGPKIWNWTLGQMTEGRSATVTRIAADVSQKVTGYMFGNLLTSLIAGTVVFVTLLVLGVPFPLLWGLWVALVDFLPMIGGALAGIPTVLFAFITGGPTAGIVTTVVFAVYTQVENHVLNPVVMSKTVRISPLLVFIAVLIGASIGNLIGGMFGGFVAALLAIPTAGALQVMVKEVWQATAPGQPRETPGARGCASRRVLRRKGGDPVPGRYVRVTGLADLFAEARRLSVQTIIFDVEPLVAPWHGSQESLDEGVARILGDVRAVPSVRVVVFATNSARRPSAVPAGDGLQVRYLASAAKPLRTAPYHGLPRPGAVAGDQLPTDGILACRLGFAFLHYAPELAGVPLGPALMHRWGQLVRPVLFRRRGYPAESASPCVARRGTGSP